MPRIIALGRCKGGRIESLKILRQGPGVFQDFCKNWPKSLNKTTTTFRRREPRQRRIGVGGRFGRDVEIAGRYAVSARQVRGGAGDGPRQAREV